MPGLTPYNLRCEHLAAPRGLNTPEPRFGWALRGDADGQVQTAYEICVGDNAANVAMGVGAHWQSGKVDSDEQSFVAYAGKSLQSDEALFWSVRVWDEVGQASDWAGVQTILTGLMNQSDWQADWIARYFVLPAGQVAPADTVYDNRWQARPADYFRREFATPSKVTRATAYVSALGLYELYVNGVRVGDEVMAPGWTDYHQRAIYQSYDVTSLIQAGDNAIGAIVGEGWYSGRVGHNQRRAGNHYGGRPALLVQMHLHHEEGTTSRVLTDGIWKTTQGPVRYSDFLMGEHFDARLELGNWACAGFDDGTWQPVEPFVPEPRAPKMTAAKAQPVRETISFDGRFLHQSKNGFVYDFGQNFAGYIRLDIEEGTARSGDSFTLRHAEILDEEGELYTANLRHAVAIDHYTAKGEGAETFKPKFTFHGFRFAELVLPDGAKPDQVKLTGIAIQNDLPVSGQIDTGNALVNQLTRNIMWSQRGNFLSVPTDCPQRDERLGWSADAQVFWRTAGFNMDIAGFWAKWFDDIADAQLPDGAFTDIAPSRPLNPYRQTAQPGAPGWGDGPVIMSWQHFLRYGDHRMLDDAYPALQSWMTHIADANPDFVRRNAVNNNYGDWLSVGPASDRAMVATAYWVQIADLMGKIAGALGKPDGQAEFETTAKAVRRAFNTEFVATDGRISGDTQTAYLLALDFKLVPEEMRATSFAHLIEKFDAADGHLQTGFLGVKHVCRVLADNGRPDYAYRVLLNETYPGWGFSIRHGATTIWERWDGWTPESGFQSANMNSFNHYAYGSIGEWLFARMAGIDWDESRPGFRAIHFKPLFDRRIGWVDASYAAPTGEVKSAWAYQGTNVRWRITIPPNCTGRVDLQSNREPDGLELGSGTHEFEIETGGDLM